MADTSSAIKFAGKVVLVTDTQEAESWVTILLNNSQTFGFDLEWKPQFSKNVVSPVAVVQLSTVDLSVVFHVAQMIGFPNSLKSLLSDGIVTKIGHGLKSDEGKLASQGITLKNVTDLQQICKGLGFKKLSLQYITAQVMGKFLDKSQSTTNWEQPLSIKQLNYAATDSWVTLMLFKRLSKYPITQSTATFAHTYCFCCEENFPDPEFLKRHNERCHSNINSCPCCANVFRSKQALKSHKQAKHDKEVNPQLETTKIKLPPQKVLIVNRDDES